MTFSKVCTPIGAHYQLWKDHINLIAELNNGKYFSGGIYFKIHLK